MSFRPYIVRTVLAPMDEFMEGTGAAAVFPMWKEMISECDFGDLEEILTYGCGDLTDLECAVLFEKRYTLKLDDPRLLELLMWWIKFTYPDSNFTFYQTGDIDSTTLDSYTWYVACDSLSDLYTLVPTHLGRKMLMKGIKFEEETWIEFD